MTRLLAPMLCLTLVLAGTLGGSAGSGPGSDRRSAAASTIGSASAGSAAGAQKAGACGRGTRRPAGYEHVVWVVLENHSYEDLIGGPGTTAGRRSPYLNALARDCGLATRSYALTHPSLPNYLAMVSGRTGGVTRSCTPAQCPQDRRTVFRQLRARGRDWRVFAESMPTACRRSDAGRYVVRHNPPTYFRDVARECAARDVPMGTTSRGRLVDDLTNDRLPAFSVVVPDQCHNTHDCPIGEGDRWLSRMVPAIVASPGYRSGRTALVVTWDEGAGGVAGQSCRRRPDRSCHVVTVVVSPTTRSGTRVSTRFDHYALLETTERLLGITTLLGHAADRRTRSMRAAFNL